MSVLEQWLKENATREIRINRISRGYDHEFIVAFFEHGTEIVSARGCSVPQASVRAYNKCRQLYGYPKTDSKIKPTKNYSNNEFQNQLAKENEDSRYVDDTDTDHVSIDDHDHWGD